MISPLGSRYAIGGALGRSVKRASGGGWWDLSGTITTCVAAYQPKGAASLAASYVNLANPGTNNAAEGSAPSFSSAGWTFNGTSNYLLISGTLPFSDSPFTMVARVIPKGLTGQQAIMAVYNSSTYSRLVLLKEVNDNKPTLYNVATQLAKNSVALQVDVKNTVAGVEASDTSHSTFVDGGNKSTSKYNVGLTNLNSGVIGARTNGSFGLFWNGIIESVALYNAALTDQNIADLHTAMNAL